MLTADWAWAAGFYEGEGSIVNQRNGHGRHQCYAVLVVCQKDLEPLARFHEVVGAGSINNSGGRDIYRWRCSKRADVERVFLAMAPMLSDRRLVQAINVLANTSTSTLPNENAAKTHCPRGHAYAGDNLYVTPRGARSCRTCKRAQHRSWRRRNQEVVPHQ